MWINKAGAEDEEDHFGLDEQHYKEMVTLGSGYLQNISQSPSTVSVITQQDIEKIGAITIEEVLETVSGIHVSHANGFLPVYVIRGVGSVLNSPVLIYLDGIPINSAVTSSSQVALSHLAKNVERIEIIKGPGSALYGADAFSGVINITTKKGEGTDMGALAGSFDTYGGWLNYGQNNEGLKINFAAQGGTTDGGNGVVESDRQTEIDRLLGTTVSLAPGSINRGRDEIDVKLEVAYQDLGRLYLRYIRNKNQNGVGISNALDNDGELLNNNWVTGIILNFGPMDWKTTFDINYTGSVIDLQSNIFPKGAVGGFF